MENFPNKPYENVGWGKYYVQAMEIVKTKQRSTTSKPKRSGVSK